MTGTVTPSQPRVGDLVRLTAECEWSDSCTPDATQVFRSGSTIYLNLYINDPWQMCLQVIMGWGTTEDLGYLPAGTYDVYVSLYAFMPWPDQGPEHILTFTVAPAPIAGDINQDGYVDVIDLLIFVEAFGSDATSPFWFTAQPSGPPVHYPYCLSDLNSDGDVDVVDLLTFIFDDWPQ